jgi:hypothetical protein
VIQDLHTTKRDSQQAREREGRERRKGEKQGDRERGGRRRDRERGREGGRERERDLHVKRSQQTGADELVCSADTQSTQTPPTPKHHTPHTTHHTTLDATLVYKRSPQTVDATHTPRLHA